VAVVRIIEQLPTRSGGRLIRVARDDHRRVDGKLADTFEDVLGRVRREVGDQLVVDRQVRGEHEEVPDALGLEQVGDERAHQPRLAHARGQREAQRGKVPLEFFDGGELALDRFQRRSWVGVLGQGDDLADAGQDFQRVALGRPEAQSVADGVWMLETHGELRGSTADGADKRRY